MTTTSHMIICDHWIGDIVYHRLAADKRKGMVTGITLCPDGLFYWVTWSDGREAKSYPIELSSEYVPDYETSE